MTGSSWSMWCAPLLLALAVLAWPNRGARARRRMAALWPPAREHAAAPVARWLRGRMLASVAAGGATLFLVGLPLGLPLAVAAAVIAHLALGRFEPASERRRKERLAADLSVTVDLMAACLRSGTTPTAAADAVSRAVGGPIGEALDEVVALLRLGGDPAESWALLNREPVLAPLGRAVGRAMSSGAPVVTALDQVAADARDQRRWAGEEAARKVGVKAAAPLGLCFLPAFVLLGVVPVVAGIATNLDLW